jgi:glycosyltransferase involved in cell wall biosynthesis
MEKSLVKSLTIVEPQADGHRMQYVRYIAREAIERGISVSVATWEESLEHPSFLLMKSELGEAFKTLLLPKTYVSEEFLKRRMDFRLQHAYFKTMLAFHRDLPATQRPESYFVSCLYMIDKIVSLFGSPFGDTEWSGIVMRETFHHASMQILAKRRLSDTVKKFLFVAMLRNRRLRRVFTIDASLPQFLAKNHPKLSHRVEYVADPVELRGTQTREEARNRFGIEAAAVVILVFGVIDSRKRIDVLIESLVGMDSSLRVVLLIAGQQSHDLRQLLNGEAARKLQATNRIFQLDTYLDDNDEFLAFRASDIVWVGYRGHYTMSAVLIQAGSIGLPVVGCREGLIGWLIDRNKLGIAVNADDVEQITESLYYLARNPLVRAEYGKNGLNHASRHTPKEFANALLDNL